MSQNKSVEQLLNDGKKYLKNKKISTAVIDAEIILMHILNFSKVQLFSKNKEITTNIQQQKYFESIQQRAKNIPVNYITGIREFMSLDFEVNTSTLIPRPDTEILVETILTMSKKYKLNYIMDVGTGTGCIPISLLYYSKDMSAIATDISSHAIDTAKQNAIKNHVEDRINFIQSDLFTAIPNNLIGKLDAIVSNPPYIPTSDIEYLMKEVRDYEPSSALDGGKDGLDFYRAITIQGQKYIRSGGFLFYEIGYNQSVAVSDIMEKQSIKDIKVLKDLAGLDRVVIGKKY